MNASVLIVDDETEFLDSVVRMLRLDGFKDVTPLSRPREAMALLSRRAFDVALLDITMPEVDGLTLLAHIKEQSPETECVMVTANENISLVVRATKLGAYDYLVKPILPEQLAHTIAQALEHRRLFESVALHARDATEGGPKDPGAFQEIVTVDPAMQRLIHESELHAVSDIPILITGETGTGKELIARALHRASRRARGPFVAVNMLALSPTLFESEFFGHVKGAFTGAERDKAGYLAQARGGSLLLDEIGDLSLDIQGKLLRFLQEGEFTPVGSSRPVAADVRFVTATNLNLEAQVLQHKFRKDLFYRLQFAHLHVPALRERRDDILVLARHFLHNSARAGVSLSAEAEGALFAYDWPGNVRELKGVLEAASNLAESGVITPSLLCIPNHATLPPRTGNPSAGQAVFLPLSSVEQRHILAVYEAAERNKSQTARILGIDFKTLLRKLKSYDVA